MKYAMDIIFRLKTICSSAIYQAMKSSKNGSSILDYLSYSMQELKQHLENNFDDKMSWDNYGDYWQIDHIIPQIRNEFMCDKCDILIACYNGDGSGETYNCIQYAKKNGKEIIIIDPTICNHHIN